MDLIIVSEFEKDVFIFNHISSKDGYKPYKMKENPLPIINHRVHYILFSAYSFSPFVTRGFLMP